MPKSTWPKSMWPKSTRRQFVALSAASALALIGAPHIARAATRKFRLGHNNAPTSGVQAGAVAFQKALLEKSEGRFDIEIFPSSQLGSDAQLTKAVSDGTLDATVSGASVFSSFHADLGLCEMPYMFKDIVTARAAYDGNLGKHLAEALKKSSIEVLAWGESGFRHVTANKAIRTPADMAGLKIRVQPAQIQVESFRGFGAAADALNFTELAEALKTGRFEAQENPIGIATANEFIQKLQSHMSLTAHVYSTFPVSFSGDVLDEMKPADRDIVRAAAQFGAKATRDFADDAQNSGLGKLKAAGMTIVTDVNTGAFQKAMEGMSDRLAKVAGPDAIARMRSLVA